MGNKSSLLLRQEEIAQIQEETGCKYMTWTVLFSIYQYIHIHNYIYILKNCSNFQNIVWGKNVLILKIQSYEYSIV